MSLCRCGWCNLNNETYVDYHDREWGVLCLEDDYLFEMLLLESFQAGLSWECVLNKRENFRRSFDGFDWRKIASYTEEKLSFLLDDPGIIRNRRKIYAAVNNARIFGQILEEHGSFSEYLKRFVPAFPLYEVGLTSSPVSDAISADLRRRGMRFVGSTIIYSYLQAVGMICSHEEGCFLYVTRCEEQR
ncbi:MAG: DNA-3-methyladenine glycosylase I [Clostridia bacterium]|nr:DNA-3-methyladenine glycosylase I [Clostridia bacterium]